MHDWNKNLKGPQTSRNKPKSQKNGVSKIKTSNPTKVIVDFEIFDPVTDNFHGIHGLMKRLLINFSLEITPLVNQIIHQSDASSVLIDSKQKAVYGIIGAVLLNENDVSHFLIE